MRNAYIIFVGDPSWQVAMAQGSEVRPEPLSVPADASLDDRAQAARRQMEAMGYAGQPVLLAVSSSHCLCAPISTGRLERGKRRRAMAFRLEEDLPVSAEDVVADYVQTSKDEALGVCCELGKLQSLLEAIDSAGIRVRHVCPSALLAAAYAVDQGEEADAVLVSAGVDGAAHSGRDFDLIELQSARPCNWWWPAGDLDELRERLSAWAASFDRPPRLILAGVEDEVRGVARQQPGIELVEAPVTDRARPAALRAAAILAGAESPWIELRRDALSPPDRYETYRRPLKALVTAAMVLLVCVSVVTRWRGHRYGSRGAQYVQQREDLYRGLFPDQRNLPPSVRARLLGEQRRLVGMSGASLAEARELRLGRRSALVQLHRILSALPRDERYRILDLKIEPSLVRVAGEARRHVEAERLALALGRSGSYDVQLPETKALRDRGVSFVFPAKPIVEPIDTEEDGP